MIDLGFSIGDAVKEIERETARLSHLEFVRYTWNYSTIDFLTGFHIEEITARLDKAMRDYAKGKSTFLEIKVPFRHHKSQTVTRTLPPHFLGEFPEAEVVVSSYSASLSNLFSRDARNLLESDKFKELYPNTGLSKEVSSVSEWATNTTVEDGVFKTLIGKTAWVGLGGSITGRGGGLIILDDFLKGRADAESEKIRVKIWESFRNDLMSRRADPCIVIVLATPWHKNDIFGMIESEMKKNKEFPRFEKLVYPARSKRYPSGYLFPEKFSKEWYEGQYATLGAYNASGLLDCDPSAREGSIIATVEGVNYTFVDGKPDGFGAFCRGWDLASSEAERQGEDPDYTVGVKVAVKVDRVNIQKLKNSEQGDELPEIVSVYIDDIVRMRKEAPERNKKMVRTALKDGRGCVQAVESFGGYKDTFTTFKRILKGVSKVVKIQLKGDKVAKASSFIEVPFEDGNIFINKNIPRETIDKFLATLTGFPSAPHDDDVDALVVGVASCLENTGAYRYKDLL